MQADPIAVTPDCVSSFDPYSYTAAALSGCGVTTFALSAIAPLPSGGESYDYSVLDSDVEYLIPPSGFEPATASAAALAEYGFPPRPTDPTALARWQGEMKGWTGPATPPPFLAESNASSDIEYSPNWSGYMIRTDGKHGDFNHAEAWYQVPQFGASRCSSNAESTWAGLGGWGSSATYLGQDGTAHNVPGIGNHQAWWEIWPTTDMLAVSPSLYGHVGYEFDASTRWDATASRYQFWLYDYESGQSASFLSTIFGDYGGGSGEAIAERPKINGSLSNLSNFGTLTFDAAEVDGNGINTWSSTGGRHGIYMGTSTHTLAYPGPIGSDGYFTDTQHNCN